MTQSALHVDLYQLTSLVAHHRAGRDRMPVTMAFFSRRLPGGDTPVRSFVLQAALKRCLSWLQEARFDEDQLAALQAQPALHGRIPPELLMRLANWRFAGIIDGALDGTLIHAGRALADGGPIDASGVKPTAYVPYLQVQTDLLSAKLIETPLLSLLNYMNMVASKATRVVAAAGHRPVYEFGTRRTHPHAAVDAALAAFIGGCAGTSNVEAFRRYGVPALGTMDHFAVQAWEEPSRPLWETERAFFREFSEIWPGGGVLLVDTYDTFGRRTGIRNAVAAVGPGLNGIRIDSGISRESLQRARVLLNELGATNARIVVSGGMDEHTIAALGDAPCDAFGVGERIVCSPDAPVGVGAVAKLVEVNGRPTMKLSRGSGKATLPGRLQAWITEAGLVVGLASERLPGRPLLLRVWEGDGPCIEDDALGARARARAAIGSLTEADRQPHAEGVRVTPTLESLIRSLAARADDDL